MYKKEYPFLKEIDSLALANVQLHLEKAYKNFFRDPKVGFPRFKSKHHSKNSYTTNVVNGKSSYMLSPDEAEHLLGPANQLLSEMNTFFYT